MAIPATLAHAVQQTQEWLKELMDNADLSGEAEAWSVLRAVLHQLRDRLTIEEAVQLSAQLPLIVRGIFFEGWQPHRVPDKSVNSRQDLLEALTMRLRPHPLAPEIMARCVFAQLARHVDPGEISNVIGQLPDEIKALWPLQARTFRERMR
ncbi:MAG: DUF2267 domain-containing protein [Hyphomicrobiaceae bacterium]|nr:DUF2267 domain-containing protein [Hyphomicrobiaceae bacterium]